MYSLSQIASLSGSRFLGKQDPLISTFLTDSRNLISPMGTLFVAISTARNDGHRFIESLIERGVQSFLIQEGAFDPASVSSPDISFVISADPLAALQKLAAQHRASFKIPVIGITGSNGKTMVKEWLYQLLKEQFSICRSPKSYNSQLGVPLSVLNLNGSHTLGIFEAGISRPGEMQKLAEIIQPETGIVTSIGSAHDEGFENRRRKIEEKLKLVEGCSKIIVNGIRKSDLPEQIQERCIVISEEGAADFRLTVHGHRIQLDSEARSLSFDIPFSDRASALNIATCVVTLLHFGFQPDDIAEKLKQVQPIALRLELKSGVGNSLVINDYYNSDLDSLKIALNFLQQHNRRARKAVIISDIEQSGMPDNLLYKEIAELISLNKIDLVAGIGKKISQYKSFFKAGALFFEQTAEFIRAFPRHSHRFADATILLKGARSFGFEEISRVLQQKSHDTVFEIDLSKLAANINYYRSLTGPQVKLMCMVKAMGYGGGSSELAKMLQHLGVSYLAVAYADEGVELRQSQVNLPVMVMSPEADGFEDIIQYRLEPEIYSFRILELFVQKLDQLGISEPYPIHVKIDTGMKRLGFEAEETDKLIDTLRKNNQIKVQSVFSHLAASDNPSLDGFTELQIKLFEEIAARIEKGIGYKFLRHICNSGGITRFKQAHYDMVRLGIGMHGVGVNEEEQKQLENVGTLKTRISQIKTVKAGETVGYNRGGVAKEEMRIATIPIGYADGFSRLLGNGKFGVYIQDKYCPTVGSVCMDMCMVDVTDVKCEEGDEVIVFETIAQLKKMAAAMNTITYEVLTSVSGRVKRVYVQE